MTSGEPRMDCLPWWHEEIARWQGPRRVILKSGYKVVDGHVNGDPEVMRKKLEADLRRMGIWRQPYPLPLEVQTLARNSSAEHGSGTPEEKMGIQLAAINKARHRGITVNKLLLCTNKLAQCRYGPIHATDAQCAELGLKRGCAPFGRWASTSRDPGVDDVLVAILALSGQADGFTRGGYDQYGPNAGISLGYGSDWAVNAQPVRAKRGEYWVGPIPGINHHEEFIYARRPDISASSPTGMALVAQAQAALRAPPPDWSRLPVCRKDSPPVPQRPPGRWSTAAKVATAIGLAAVGMGAYYFTTSLDEPPGRWM